MPQRRSESGGEEGEEEEGEGEELLLQKAALKTRRSLGRRRSLKAR
jgi:hypothetical protein